MANKEKLNNTIPHNVHHGKPVFLDFSSFCVFNSSMNVKEGEEHKKILYFYPPEASIDVQVRQIGLMEAITKFVRSFSDNDCRTVRTSQRLHVMISAEEGYWMVLTLSIRRTSDYSRVESDDFERTRDEQPQDDTYFGILQRSYRMYRMLYGPMGGDLADNGLRQLKQRLAKFFGNYFLKLSFSQYDVLDRFEAMSYLPMERNVFLNVQSVVNSLFVQFSAVKHALILYSDYVIWNDVELEQAQTVAQYITRFVIPEQLEKERQAIYSSGSTSQFPAGHLGRFYPGVFRDEDSDSFVISAYLTNLESNEITKYEITKYEITKYELLVYGASSTTICLFLQNPSIAQNGEYIRRMESYLGPALTQLAGNLAEQCSKAKNPSWTYDSPYVHYVYLNKANLSKKQNLVDGNRAVQAELLKALACINEDISHQPDDVEIFAKVLHDCWIYGRKNFDRSLYGIITQRNADLELAEDEIRKLCAKEFPAMYDYHV